MAVGSDQFPTHIVANWKCASVIVDSMNDSLAPTTTRRPADPLHARSVYGYTTLSARFLIKVNKQPASLRDS